MEMAKARNPPVIIIKVSNLRKVLMVMVAPMMSPRKIVAVFMIVSEAAWKSRLVSAPTSFTKLPNSRSPTKGVAVGTRMAIMAAKVIGNKILTRRRFLISRFSGNNLSCSFILIFNSCLLTVKLTTNGIMTGTKAI